MRNNHLLKSIISIVLMIAFMLATAFVPAGTAYGVFCASAVFMMIFAIYHWYRFASPLMFYHNHQN